MKRLLILFLFLFLFLLVPFALADTLVTFEKPYDWVGTTSPSYPDHGYEMTDEVFLYVDTTHNATTQNAWQCGTAFSTFQITVDLEGNYSINKTGIASSWAGYWSHNYTVEQNNTGSWVQMQTTTCGAGAPRCNATVTPFYATALRFKVYKKCAGGSQDWHTIQETAAWGVNATSPVTIPEIDVSSYNHSTASNATAEIVWRTNTSTRSKTDDTTPTIRFDTGVDAWCRIGNESLNWSQMGNTRNCATTNDTSHVCSIIAGDTYVASSGLNYAYISCTNMNDFTLENATGTSTSGPLALHLGPDPESTLCANISGDLDFRANISRGSYNPKLKLYNESFIQPVNASLCGYTYLLNNTALVDINWTFTTNYTNYSENYNMYVNNIEINDTNNHTITVSQGSHIFVNWTVNLTNWNVLSQEPSISFNIVQGVA